MSRNLTTTSTQFPLSPGAQAVSTVFTTSGFNAGDYVYAYNGSSVGFPKAATISMGSTNTIVAGSTVSSSLVSVDSRAASYGPFSDISTYAGSTTSVGSIVVSPVTLSSAYANGCVTSTALVNGNIAYVYATGSGTLVGAIYTPTGTLVGSPVTITTSCPTGTPSRNSICGVADGGYVVHYYDSGVGTMRITKISSSNVEQTSFTTYGSLTETSQIAAIPNGMYAVCYYVNLGDPTFYVRIFSATNSLYSTYSTSVSSLYSINIAGTTNNNFYIYLKDAGNGSMYRVLINISGSVVSGGSISSFGYAVNGSYNQTCSTSLTSSPTYSTGDNSAVAYVNSSNIMCIGRSSGTSTSNINTGVSGIILGIAATDNGGFSLVYKSLSDAKMYVKQYDGIGSLISTVALTSTGIVSNNFYNTTAGLIGSKVTVGYMDSSDGYPRFLTFNTSALTNGVTQFTGTTTYTPNTGYYLLGVAATTAAANTTGLVITNGSATLNSSYPSVTSPINFDYSGNAFTSRSTTNANKGTVVGRTVILKGLE